MRPWRPLSGAVAFAAMVIGMGVFLGLADWPHTHRTLEFSGLVLAAAFASALAMSPSTTRDWAVMPLSFVINFSSLLLFGPHATMLVAATGIVTEHLMNSQRVPLSGRMLLNAAAVLVAIQAAGFAHWLLGGTIGHFVWPGQGVPIAAAVVAYCGVKNSAARIIVPLVASPDH